MRRRPLILLAALIAALAAVGSYLALRPGTPLFARHVADRDPSNARPLVMSFVEVDRDPRTSLVEVAFESGTSVASSMWTMRCAIELAEERNARFLIVLQERRAPDGAWLTLYGFADRPESDVGAYFGIGQAGARNREWLSVDEFRQVLPAKRTAQPQ